MQITLTVNSLEELVKVAQEIVFFSPKDASKEEDPKEEAKKYVEVSQKITKELNKDNSKSLEEMVEDTAKEPKKKLDKKLQVEVRQLLKDVNDKADKNLAKGWIKESGYESFTKIDDNGVLQALKDKAKEYIDA